MHEFSVAYQIAQTVLEIASQKGAKSIKRVEIEVGRLTFLGVDQLKFWVESCLENTIGAGAQIDLKTVEPRIKCDSCGYEGEMEMVDDDPIFHLSLPRLECPKCGSTDLEITAGRDCLIRRIEISV